MATRTLLKNDVSIEEWLAATTLRNKETQYSEKYCFLRLNPVTYKKKMLYKNEQLLWTTVFSYELLFH